MVGAGFPSILLLPVFFSTSLLLASSYGCVGLSYVEFKCFELSPPTIQSNTVATITKPVAAQQLHCSNALSSPAIGTTSDPAYLFERNISCKTMIIGSKMIDKCMTNLPSHNPRA